MKILLRGHVSRAAINAALTEGCPFVIRDLADDPDRDSFDILFVEGDTIRYSDDVWDSPEEAQDALKVFSEGSEKPTWWDEYTPKGVGE